MTAVTRPTQPAGTESHPPDTRASRLRRLLPFTGLIAVLVEVVYFATQASTFLSSDNLLNIGVQGAVVAVAAFGLSVVVIVGGDDVISGGIDLSIGAVIGLSGSVVSVLFARGHHLIPSLLWGLAAAMAVGVGNAVAVLIGVRPLLATLAMSGIAGSADLLVSDNSQIALRDPFFVWMRDAKILGVPFAVVVVAVLFVAVWMVMGFTRYGVRAYATGGNPLAARVASIRVNRYVALSYIFASVCAAVAGLLLTARLSSSSPGAGSSLLPDVILASFMSVIFSRRLVVNIPGTLIAALLVAGMSNGFTLINIPTYWVGGVKGVLILAVVALSAIGPERRK